MSLKESQYAFSFSEFITFPFEGSKNESQKAQSKGIWQNCRMGQVLRQTQSLPSRGYSLEGEEAVVVKGAHGVAMHSREGTWTTQAKDAAGLLRGQGGRGREPSRWNR